MLSYTTAIFCGGQNRRMGRDKATLTYNGDSFLRIIITSFSNKHPVLLSTGSSSDKYQIPNSVEIADRYANRGPLGGLEAILSASPTEWTFICACDMPKMTQQFADTLLLSAVNCSITSHAQDNSFLCPPNDKLPDCQAVIPRDSFGRHPLAGFYHRSILPILRKQLCTGSCRMTELLDEINVSYINIDEWTSDLKQCLTNINTPEEYTSLLSYDTGTHSRQYITFCGYSNSGKTTLICKIVEKLSQRDFSICVVKHTHHTCDALTNNSCHNLITPSRRQITDEYSNSYHDSDQFLLHGAKASVLIGPDHINGISFHTPTLNNAIALLPPADLILMEGFKNSSIPAIWITENTSVNESIPLAPKRLKAIICPNSDQKNRLTSFYKGIPVFTRDETDEIANLILSIFFNHIQ